MLEVAAGVQFHGKFYIPDPRYAGLDATISVQVQPAVARRQIIRLETRTPGANCTQVEGEASSSGPILCDRSPGVRAPTARPGTRIARPAPAKNAAASATICSSSHWLPMATGWWCRHTRVYSPCSLAALQMPLAKMPSLPRPAHRPLHREPGNPASVSANFRSGSHCTGEWPCRIAPLPSHRDHRDYRSARSPCPGKLREIVLQALIGFARSPVRQVAGPSSTSNPGAPA